MTTIVKSGGQNLTSISKPFVPTEEQLAIVDAAKNSADNLAVIARAGAAKTSTLILIAEALPETKILCVAFNKKIADEMKERLPPNCEAKTLHAIGYKAWWQFIRKNTKVNDKKIYDLFRDHLNTLSAADREDAYSCSDEIIDAIKAAKIEGYLPQSFRGHWKPLINDEEFFDKLPFEPTPLQISIINEILIASFKAALEGEIDFDDMIFCPALCSVSWPSFPLTLIDEAQDLSPINHYILKKIVRQKRIIGVGDPLQAIYGFRGALADSMDRLIRTFSMKQFKLTMSFRCAKNITKNAHWLAPDMRYPDWAEDGQVLRPETWSPADLAAGDAIICRNNAPLFSLAIKMIEAGLLPEISGRDLAQPLKKILKKLGKPSLPRVAALAALEDWRKRELARARNGATGLIYDRAACLKIILDRTQTLGDAIAYLDHLLKRDGRIYLMTGHKSKGLEFNNVFFLDQHLCNKNQPQDNNIKYVIETRAKKKLTYVTSETFCMEPVNAH